MIRHAISFAKKFQLKFPVVVQAPMAGGITTPELVAAVSNSGGLGSFATGYLSTQQVKDGVQAVKRLTANPFAVNVFIPEIHQSDHEQIQNYQKSLNKFRGQLGMEVILEEIPVELPRNNFNEIIAVILEEEVKIVSFTFGNLSPDMIATFKENNVYLMGTATSVKEGKILEKSGVDAIIAQGHEAGGHRGGFSTPHSRGSMGTMSLVPQMVNACDCPVIAAGGIMNGSGVLAAITMGASGVQMGTAFLTVDESGADKTYRDQLAQLKNGDADMTRVTKVYSGKSARAIDTDFIVYMEAHGSAPPPYPITHVLCGPIRKAAVQRQAVNIMSMWCGQGAPLLTQSLTAAEFLARLHVDISQSLDEVSTLSIKKN